MKLSQSNFNIRSPDCYLVCSYLIATVPKVCLSHRVQVGTERGLGTLQHSFWPDICSNCLAIWRLYEFCVSPWIFIHQVVSAWVQTADPWIIRPALPLYTRLYTMGDSAPQIHSDLPTALHRAVSFTDDMKKKTSRNLSHFEYENTIRKRTIFSDLPTALHRAVSFTDDMKCI